METLRDLQQTVGGQLLPEGRVHDLTAVPLGRIVTDSRQVAAGDVFLALEGQNHDGASFAGEAFRRGTAGAVVASPIDVPEDCWALLVDDTHLALEQWARWKRRQFTGTLIAVTGSVGKTTTRQMIDTVLRRRLRRDDQPAERQPSSRRAVRAVGARSGRRLRRAGVGCQPAGRDRGHV